MKTTIKRVAEAIKIAVEKAGYDCDYVWDALVDGHGALLDERDPGDLHGREAEDDRILSELIEYLDPHDA